MGFSFFAFAFLYNFGLVYKIRKWGETGKSWSEEWSFPFFGAKRRFGGGTSRTTPTKPIKKQE
jgi:hypothetical protein